MDISFAPLLMFLFLFFLLALGIPIAFALCFISIVTAWVLWGISAISILTSAAWGTMNQFPLIAVALYVYMAFILQKIRVVEDLYDAFYKWFGGVRGGLAVTSIIVGAILGAISGVVAAGVIGLGLIALPQMRKYGYDKNISLGSVLAGGTLGQIVPPSTIMVIYGTVTNVSIGALFAGGVSCGFFLAAIFSIYILARSFFKKDLCPALKKEERLTFIEKVKNSKGILAPLVLIISVLGSVFSGAATPTEAAGVGSFGALVIGLANRRLTFKIAADSAWETLGITAMVAWIIIGATAFGSVFAGTGGNQLVMTLAAGIPGGKVGVLLVGCLFVFFLGMFLDTGAVVMIAAPILSSVMTKIGINPLLWGLVFLMLLQTAYISPPVGLSLFYLKGIVPDDITIKDIYWATPQFIMLQILAIVLVLLFPMIGLYLPKLLGFIV